MRDPRHPRWPDEGERTHRRDIAERWAAAYVKMLDEAHVTRALGRVETPPLGQAIERYLEHRGRVVESRTLAGDRTVLRHLRAAFPASTPLHMVNVQSMVNELLDEGYQPSTVRQYVTSLRSLWRWLELPFPAVDLPRPGTGDVRYWTDAEVARLRAAAPKIDPQLLLALDLTLFMGLRVGELVATRWEDIDLATSTVRVHRQIAQGRAMAKPLKGKRARTSLILPGWAHPPGTGLVVARDEAPVGRRVQWRWMQKLLAAAKLSHKGAGWHMGRHTYARSLLEGGGSLEQLQVFLGHSSIRTTEQVYGHFRPSVAAEMAKRAIYGR